MLPDDLPPDVAPAVTQLVVRAGGSGRLVTVRLRGGANNRVWRIDTAGRTYLLKQYFHHPAEVRNRLDSELAFLTFAWDRGIRSVPRALAHDAERRLLLMEHVAGRRLESHDVSAERATEAAAFFRELNRHRSARESLTIGRAAEACFSLDEHLETVAVRVERVRAIDASGPVHREAVDFVERELRPAWERVDADLRRHEVRAEPLDPAELCLSPSDFGFHNAILEPDGRLRFHDFEYAGWDDPARMLCDFFLQVRRPLPVELREPFAQEALADFPRFGAAIDRARRLLPLYRVKWCCLLLNEFLEVSAARRAFAGHEATDDAKARQLAMARRMLRR